MPAARIRFDRVIRVFFLLVVLGVLASFVGPARSYLQTRTEAQERRAEVQQLQRENKRLRVRRQQLRDPALLEREARKLGMVKPGERPYVVKNLPPG